jgi:hypothetical protein
MARVSVDGKVADFALMADVGCMRVTLCLFDESLFVTRA